MSIVCSSKPELQLGSELIEYFCDMSGAEINVRKSLGSWLVPWPELVMDIQWTASLSNYSGVGLDLARLSSGEGGVRLNDVRAKAAEWPGRNISRVN